MTPTGPASTPRPIKIIFTLITLALIIIIGHQTLKYFTIAQNYKQLTKITTHDDPHTALQTITKTIQP